MHIETNGEYIFNFEPSEEFWNNPPLFKTSYDSYQYEDSEGFLENAQFHDFNEDETVEFYVDVFYYEEDQIKKGYVKMSGIVYGNNEEGFELVVYNFDVKPTGRGLGTEFFRRVYPKFTQHNWQISVDEGQTDEGRIFFDKMYRLGYIIG